MGFGLMEVSSDILVPSPPARMTAFTDRIRLFVKKTVCPASAFRGQVNLQARHAGTKINRQTR
jgi:hypothetical protein